MSEAEVLVITGGSRGIGRATVELFTARAAKVVNVSRSPCTVEGAINVRADFAEPGWLAGVETELASHLEGASRVTLVHNSGLLLKDSAREIDGVAFARALQVNVIACAELNAAILPRMPKGSSVIFVGSTLSEKAVAGTLSYVTSKHAMLGLMRATAQDLVGSGVHTACVCPGFTNTEMLRDHVGNDEAILASIAGGVAFGRLIEPVEIAETILFCADHPVINGACIHANLGQIES